MNRRVLTVLSIAFVIAAACALAVLHLVHKNMGAANQPKVITVVAAKADIKLGTVLSASDLTNIQMSGALPPGSIQDPKKVVGRGVVSDIYQGEPIMESRLAPPGSGGGLASTIPNGMRACAVKVDDVAGVVGFVSPGMFVDVIISGMPPGAQNSATSDGTQVRTLLQALKVLSAGTDIEKNAEGKPKPVQVVTLLVTPEQAETLSLAGSQTRIQLVLRNPLDSQVAQVPGNALSDLYTGGKPKAISVVTHKATKKPAPESFAVEVFNGTKGSVEKFAAPEGK